MTTLSILFILALTLLSNAVVLKRQPHAVDLGGDTLPYPVPAQGPTLDTRFAVRQATPPVLPPDISPANLAPPTPTGEDPPVPTEG